LHVEGAFSVIYETLGVNYVMGLTKWQMFGNVAYCHWESNSGPLFPRRFAQSAARIYVTAALEFCYRL